MDTLPPNETQRWLESYCKGTQHIVGGVVVLADTVNQTFHTAAEWPPEGPLTSSLVVAVQKAYQNPEPKIFIPDINTLNAEHSHVVVFPLRSGERFLGALVLAVRAPDDDFIQTILRDFERSRAKLVSSIEQLSSPAPLNDAARVLYLQTVLLGQSQLAAAASAFASELAVSLKFDRVSVGMLERGRVNLVAISHSAEFNSHQGLLRAITAAMEEAVDQCASIIYPAIPGGKPQIILAHADLAARTGSAIYSVPLISANLPVGALTFERAGTTPPTLEEVSLCEHIACLTGPLLALKRRAEQPLLERHAEALRGLWARFARRDDHKPKFVAGGVLAAITLFLLLPVPYHVGAPVRIEGAVQRIIAAPSDGFLLQAHVRPGDAVHAGDVLVELVNQDLLLEQRKWESELAQYENSYSSALARADRVQYVNNQAKANQARAELDLVQLQLARSRITAPIDGIVIKGDLSQSLGAPVKQGEELLKLVPANAFRLIIEVDERDIRAIHPGQKGHLALSALPGDTLGFTVERIIPVATSIEGRNIFEVEGKLGTGNMPLRPGLQGIAKIEVGSRTSAWILSHRIVNWLRLTVWSWGV